MSIVAICGIDGAGKYTQAKMLTEYLNAALFSFPNYETETGQVILGNLQERWSVMARVSDSSSFEDVGGRKERRRERLHINALALQSLFAINRYEIASKIDAIAKKDQHVVLDRYWPSGVVYGVCDGLDEEWLIRIHERLPQPDVWFLLDVSPEASVERRPERRDRYEADGNMDKRRELYRKLWADRQGDTVPVVEENSRDGKSSLTHYLSKWILVDGTGTVDEVHTTIIKHLSARGIR